jgi:hypothetical protein
VRYTPNANYCNTPPGTTLDTFSYTLSGGPTATVRVTVTCVGDAPVVTTSPGSTTFTPGSGPVVVDPNVTVADLDSANLASATVVITSPADGAAEALAATTANTPITATYNTPSRTLTLAGAAPIAQYQQVLRSVTYATTPSNSAPRTIAFKVNDGALDSNAATKTLTIAATNNAPTVTTSAGTTTFAQGGAPVVVDASVTVTDPDSANLTGATVTITNVLDSGQEILAANVSGAPIAVGYQPATGTLTLTGTATVAEYQKVLRTVTYDNAAATPNSANRVIAFQANDGSAMSTAANKTVALTAAPVVQTSPRNTTATEGNAAIVDGSLTVSDADSTNLASATVTITNLLDSGSEVLAVGTFPGITSNYAAPT